MTSLAEMRLSDRKSLSKEELRDQLDREHARDAIATNQKFEFISDEKVEEIYNSIQADTFEPVNAEYTYLRRIIDDVIDDAERKQLPIADTVEALKAKIVLEEKLGESKILIKLCIN